MSTRILFVLNYQQYCGRHTDGFRSALCTLSGLALALAMSDMGRADVFEAKTQSGDISCQHQRQTVFKRYDQIDFVTILLALEH